VATRVRQPRAPLVARLLGDLGDQLALVGLAARGRA
jgi:hypothetical protein